MQMFGHVLVAILQDIAFGEFNHQLLYRIDAKPVIVQVMQQQTVGKVTGSDINRDMKMRLAGEGIQAAGGFGDHIAGEGNNQIVPFGDGNKYLAKSRRGGVVPAQQDLNPAAASAARASCSGWHQRVNSRAVMPRLISREKLILPAVASQAMPVINRLKMRASGSSPGSSSSAIVAAPGPLILMVKGNSVERWR